MALPNKRTVATWFEDDHIRLIEQDVPDLRPGSIAVDVGASSVSPGSELSANRDGREVLGGWRSLAEQGRSADAGSQPRAYGGYSNAGIVIAVGEGVTRFRPGDRVACIGGGYAVHRYRDRAAQSRCPSARAGDLRAGKLRDVDGHRAARAAASRPQFRRIVCCGGAGRRRSARGATAHAGGGIASSAGTRFHSGRRSRGSGGSTRR